jgi:hypothetical protein
MHLATLTRCVWQEEIGAKKCTETFQLQEKKKVARHPPSRKEFENAAMSLFRGRTASVSVAKFSLPSLHTSKLIISGYLSVSPRKGKQKAECCRPSVYYSR